MFSRQKQILSRTIITAIGVIFSVSFCCFANQDTKNYSEIFKKYVIIGRTKGGSISFPPNMSDVEEFRDANGIKFLIDVLKKGPDWKEEQRLPIDAARCIAAYKLGLIGDKTAFEPLVEILKNGESVKEENKISPWARNGSLNIKRFAAQALGSLGDQRAVGPLVNALETNNDSTVRAASAGSLGQLKSLDAVKPLVKILQNKDENREVRQCCIDSLIMISDMRTLPTILTVAEELNHNANFSNMTRIDLGVHMVGKLVKDEKTGAYRSNWISTQFSELRNYDSIPKIWLQWFKNGRKWTQEKFDKYYTVLEETKQKRPNEKAAIMQARRDITKAGVGALPLLIDKIKQGETDLIPVVSQLSGYDIKGDANSAAVLKWWDANKERWTIPFPDDN